MGRLSHHKLTWRETPAAVAAYLGPGKTAVAVVLVTVVGAWVAALVAKIWALDHYDHRPAIMPPALLCITALAAVAGLLWLFREFLPTSIPLRLPRLAPPPPSTRAEKITLGVAGFFAAFTGLTYITNEFDADGPGHPYGPIQAVYLVSVVVVLAMLFGRRRTVSGSWVLFAAISIPAINYTWWDFLISTSELLVIYSVALAVGSVVVLRARDPKARQALSAFWTNIERMPLQGNWNPEKHDPIRWVSFDDPAERNRIRAFGLVLLWLGIYLPIIMEFFWINSNPLSWVVGFLSLCILGPFFNNVLAATIKRDKRLEGPERYEQLIVDGEYRWVRKGRPPEGPTVAFQDQPSPQKPADVAHARVFNKATGQYEYQQVMPVSAGNPDVKPEPPKVDPEGELGSAKVAKEDDLRRAGLVDDDAP